MVKLEDFHLERFFAKYEFTTSYLLCSSDCESMSLEDLLALEPSSWQDFQRISLGYTESLGDPTLRSHIGDLYKSISKDEILVHSGAQEAIFIFMNVALEKGDHVIVQSPSYQSLYEVAHAMGCEITPLPMEIKEGRYSLNLTNLEASIQKNTKAIVINTPHNPTGYLLSKEELELLLSVSRENQLLLFSDEVYRYLEYETKDQLPWVCDLYHNAISLGVMSKSFGLAGLRIGWVATKNQDLLGKMAAFKDYTSICNSAPSEFLAALALRQKEKILKRNQGIIGDNLQMLYSFFSRYLDLFTWYPPMAGPIAFPRINTTQDFSSIVKDLVHEKGVLLLPGACYGYDDGFFRIGFGRKNMKEALFLFEEYVKEKWG